MSIKTLVIIRGLPGSGKSTFARLIAPQANVAADDFFIDEAGHYNYDGGLVADAHLWCYRTTEDFLREGHSVVAVHNTFTTNKRFIHYQRLAAKYGYQFTVVHVEGDYGDVHNVPQSAKDRFAKQWEAYNPKAFQFTPAELGE